MNHPIYLSLLIAYAALISAPYSKTARSQTAQSSNQAITQQSDAKRKINLAGRQRMLSQHIAKSVCFVAMDIDAEANRGRIAQAQWLFQSTLKDLRDGSSTQNMLPETNKNVVEGLRNVSRVWVPFSAAVNSWLLGFDNPEAALTTVFEMNLPLLRESHKTVGLIETAYAGNATVATPLAKAINVAGRQRMLSQRMSKEFCLVLLDHQAKDNRARLKETMSLFERSMDGLINGSKELGLDKAPSGSIAEQLNVVLGIYANITPALKKAVAAGKVPKENVVKVSRSNLLILSEMDKAVYLYEALN